MEGGLCQSGPNIALQLTADLNSLCHARNVAVAGSWISEASPDFPCGEEDGVAKYLQRHLLRGGIHKPLLLSSLQVLLLGELQGAQTRSPSILGTVGKISKEV